jgi:hypothetical protein
MHKKLAADLTSLAHRILQLKNKEDVLVLKQKAYEVYEKLTVLAYVDEYINTTPNASETKEEILKKIENVVVKKRTETQIEEPFPEEGEEIVVEFVAEKTDEHVVIAVEEETLTKEEPTLKVVKEIIEQPFDELEKIVFPDDDDDVVVVVVKKELKHVESKKAVTLEEELEGTISIDIATDLFEKPAEKKSLNDLFQTNIQIGLNDRIAFVKNLFEGNQEDFNRVVSQLNTFKTEKEAKKFIHKMVKPDYNWKNQEEYEERFMAIIGRKFA